MTMFLAVAVKLAMVFAFAALIACIGWLLFKAIPDGRVKVFLFKVRDGSGFGESSGEKILTRVLAVLFFVVLYAGIWWFITQ